MDIFRRQAGFFLFFTALQLPAFSPDAAAQEDTLRVLTLGQCLEICRQTSLELSLNDLEREIADRKILESRIDLIPEISASAVYGTELDRGMKSRSRYLQPEIGIALEIGEYLAKIYAIRERKYERERTRLQRESILYGLTLRTLRVYTSILKNESLLRAARESFNSGKEQVKLTEELVRSGIQTHHALLEMKAQHAAEKAEVIEAEKEVANSYLELMELLGADGPRDFRIDGNPIRIGERIHIVPADEMFRIICTLPERQQLEIDRKVMENDIRELQTGFVPELRIAAGYGSLSAGEHPFSLKGLYYGRRFSATIQIGIPIGTYHRKIFALRNSRTRLKALDKEILLTEQQMRTAISAFINTALADKEHFLAADEHRKASEESFRYITRLFNLGMISGTDYTIAKSNLYRSLSEYYTARYELIFSLLVIDFLKLTTFADKKNRTL